MWGILDRTDSFENPVLQQHFRNLEALALDMLEPEQAEDLTSENYWWMLGEVGLRAPDFVLSQSFGATKLNAF